MQTLVDIVTVCLHTGASDAWVLRSPFAVLTFCPLLFHLHLTDLIKPPIGLSAFKIVLGNRPKTCLHFFTQPAP